MAPVSSTDEASSQFKITIHELNKSKITISEYIYLRIQQLGIKSIFGVPGDFNLSFLEHLYTFRNLGWIGCCNELNAAYAADAYSKVSGSLSVLVTTFGVGELSAINGIAGSYSEYSPVLHIVGTSALSSKDSPLNFHHLVTNKSTLMKPDHYVYEKIAKNFSVVDESIVDDWEDACNKVDRIIETIVNKSRPGYLFLPCDLTEMEVPIERLNFRLNLGYESVISEKRLNEVTDAILNALYKSKNPSFIPDFFINKFKLQQELKTFVEKLDDKINIFDTFQGKGLVHEDSNRFVGTYNGKIGDDYITESIESSDLVLHVGNFDNEVNSGFHTFKLEKENKIELNPNYVSVRGEIYQDVNLMDIFPALVSRLDTSKLPTSKRVVKPTTKKSVCQGNLPLTEEDLFSSIQSSIQPNDILISDTCSFIFSLFDLKLRGAKFINQMLWGAIGYAIPATLGASIALKDFDIEGKVITIEGDGSAQMSLQELSSILRYKIDPIIFILNNDGYTIERVIKGPNRSYNDISGNWQWCNMLKCFGDLKEEYSKSIRVTSEKELNDIMHNAKFRNSNMFQLVELILPKFDVPDNLHKMLGH